MGSRSVRVCECVCVLACRYLVLQPRDASWLLVHAEADVVVLEDVELARLWDEHLRAVAAVYRVGGV